MSYYDATNMPEGKLAQQYTMADNFFHAAFGGSFLNHFWLICACSPTWPNAPGRQRRPARRQRRHGQGRRGHARRLRRQHLVHRSTRRTRPTSPTRPSSCPSRPLPTIGDRLNDKGISWAWYSGGWNDALAGHPDPLFQFHHQPFAYFANYADGTPGQRRAPEGRDGLHARPARRTTCPPSSFIKPLGADNEHPGYADLPQGQQHVADLVSAVQSSPYWDDTAIIITYDENGGRWDHVAPPTVDSGARARACRRSSSRPSPRRASSTTPQYDTTSILKFIETRWGLAPLGTRDAARQRPDQRLRLHRRPDPGHADHRRARQSLAARRRWVLLFGAGWALRRRRAA